MYKTITGIDSYEEPMRIYPAGHYTMGGLWVDYELMTTIPGSMQSENPISRIMEQTVWVQVL